MTDDHPTEEEIAELLGAYALDAVSEEERRMVDEVLRDSPRLRAEVDAHREVASLLAYSGADAPDGVWDRIQGELDGADDAVVLQVPFGRPEPVERPEDPGRAGPSRWLAAAGGAVAAAILMVVGFVVLDDGEPATEPELDGIAAASTEAFADDRARTARFSVGVSVDAPVEAAVLESGRGFIRADGLPDLPADRTYQLWGLSGDQVVSLGVLGAKPDVAAFEAGPLVTQLMLTEEVVGGVPQSQNPAIGVGELR